VGALWASSGKEADQTNSTLSEKPKETDEYDLEGGGRDIEDGGEKPVPVAAEECEGVDTSDLITDDTGRDIEDGGEKPVPVAAEECEGVDTSDVMTDDTEAVCTVRSDPVWLPCKDI